MNIVKRIVAQFVVPEGMYCYRTLGVLPPPLIGIRIEVCRYWEHHDNYNAPYAYCRLLKIGDDPLLDDQCKICGIKDDEIGD